MKAVEGLVCRLSTGNVADSPGQPAGLVCREVWGGNRMFHGPIELPGIRGVLFTQPCDGARGGDVHYLSVCGSGMVSRVCLADVTGHGESVSAVSHAMHDLLRRSVDRMDERRVLRKLNLRLSAMDGERFTTAVAMTYFPPLRRLSISYAGHEPAWYYRAAERRWSQLEPSARSGFFGIALAADPKSRYTRRIQRTAAGDRLLMFTDGVIEAPSPSGELFGRPRLVELLGAHRDRTPDQVVRAVVDALGVHTQRRPLDHDDVSLLMIEFVDNLKSSALWTALANRLFNRRRRLTSS